VLTVRQRAAPIWLVLGNLSVFSGVLALWEVPQDASEFAAGRSDQGAYVMRLGTGWAGRESHGRQVWTWAANRGRVEIETWPQKGGTMHLQLALRALTPRAVEIRQDEKLLWRGEVGPKLQSIDVAGVHLGNSAIEFSSDLPPVPESSTSGARALGFAIYDLRLN
jgi:hypothetical protein